MSAKWFRRLNFSVYYGIMALVTVITIYCLLFLGYLMGKMIPDVLRILF